MTIGAVAAVAPAIAEVVQAAQPAQTGYAPESGSIRVGVEKLDELINHLSQLQSLRGWGFDAKWTENRDTLTMDVVLTFVPPPQG